MDWPIMICKQASDSESVSHCSICTQTIFAKKSIFYATTGSAAASACTKKLCASWHGQHKVWGGMYVWAALPCKVVMRGRCTHDASSVCISAVPLLPDTLVCHLRISSVGPLGAAAELKLFKLLQETAASLYISMPSW